MQESQHVIMIAEEHVTPLICGVQALAGMCRSYLGPYKAAKCVLQDCSKQAAHSTLATSSQQLLHAVDGDPTSTTLLLEYMEAQIKACGGGSTWLLVLAGLLTTAFDRLRRDGCPLNTLIQYADLALGLCEQVLKDCAVPLEALLLQPLAASHAAGGAQHSWTRLSQHIFPCDPAPQLATTLQTTPQQPVSGAAHHTAVSGTTCAAPRALITSGPSAAVQAAQPIIPPGAVRTPAHTRASGTTAATVSDTLGDSEEDMDWFFEDCRDRDTDRDGQLPCANEPLQPQPTRDGPGTLQPQDDRPRTQTAAPVPLWGGPVQVDHGVATHDPPPVIHHTHDPATPDLHPQGPGTDGGQGLPEQEAVQMSQQSCGILEHAQQAVLCQVAGIMSHGQEEDTMLAAAVLAVLLQQLQHQASPADGSQWGNSAPLGGQCGQQVSRQQHARHHRHHHYHQHAQFTHEHHHRQPHHHHKHLDHHHHHHRRHHHHTPGDPSLDQSSSGQSVRTTLSQLQQLCALAHWDEQVSVVDLQGVDLAASCVLPGVCLRMQDLSMHQQVQHILPLVSRHMHLTREGRSGAGDARSTDDTAPETGRAVCVGLVEGGLGLLTAQPADWYCDQSTDLMAPGWVHLGSTHTEVQHCRGASETSVTDSGLVEAAAAQVSQLLQPMGVDLVLLTEDVPAHLTQRVHELSGIAVVGQVPIRAVTMLAAACGATVAAGLAGLQHGGAGIGSVQLCVLEAGRQGTVGRGADLEAHQRQQQAGQSAQQFLVVTPALCQHATQTHGVGIRPAVTVLVTGLTQVGLARSMEQLHGSFHRLQDSLVRGQCLPGGGVFELLCAQVLEEAAAAAASVWQAAGVAAAGESSGGGESVPAWHKANQALRLNQAAWGGPVLQAMASCMEQVVEVVLQNTGQSYSECLGRVGRARQLLHHSVRTVSQRGSTRMAAAPEVPVVCAAQQMLLDGGVGGEGGPVPGVLRGRHSTQGQVVVPVPGESMVQGLQSLSDPGCGLGARPSVRRSKPYGGWPVSPGSSAPDSQAQPGEVAHRQGPSGEDQGPAIVGDSVSARRHALQALRGLMRQVFSADAHIVNDTSAGLHSAVNS